MMTRRIAQLRGYVIRARRMPRATGVMFAARSPWGRSVKMFLFGIGLLVPLGSLIWALLFWHGNGVHRRSPGTSNTASVAPRAIRNIRSACRLANTGGPA
jgi:hypothetical protein